MKKIFICLMALAGSNLLIAQPVKINFTAKEFYPEGIAYNSSTKEFYIGSVKTGTINTVNESGVTKKFYEDPSLMSSFGMKTDTRNNLLWVCTGDPNYSIYSTGVSRKKLAKLVALDLATGTKKKDIDLAAVFPGDHFINDMIMDDAGNIYITDSYSPVIYKVDNKNTATVLVQHNLFQSADVGLNGIAWYPQGYLVVVNNGSGAILKVDLATKAVSKVRTDNFYPGADGLIRSGQQELIMVVNKGINKIFKLASTDDWRSAKLVSATAAEDRFSNPSTAVMVNNKIYVVNAKLDEITDRSRKPSELFSLQQAVLRPVE